MTSSYRSISSTNDGDFMRPMWSTGDAERRRGLLPNPKLITTEVAPFHGPQPRGPAAARAPEHSTEVLTQGQSVLLSRREMAPSQQIDYSSRQYWEARCNYRRLYFVLHRQICGSWPAHGLLTILRLLCRSGTRGACLGRTRSAGLFSSGSHSQKRWWVATRITS